jgi:hypothetical protein
MCSTRCGIVMRFNVEYRNCLVSSSVRSEFSVKIISSSDSQRNKQTRCFKFSRRWKNSCFCLLRDDRLLLSSSVDLNVIWWSQYQLIVLIWMVFLIEPGYLNITDRWEPASILNFSLSSTFDIISVIKRSDGNDKTLKEPERRSSRKVLGSDPIYPVLSICMVILK